MTTWSDTRTEEWKEPENDPPWLVVVEHLDGILKLDLMPEGAWSIAPGVISSCGPDGHFGLPILADALILPSAPPGALIGKFGGSTAAVGPKPAEGPPADAPFLIGARLVFPVKEPNGPLMVGINALIGVKPKIEGIKFSFRSLT